MPKILKCCGPQFQRSLAATGPGNVPAADAPAGPRVGQKRIDLPPATVYAYLSYNI